MSEARRLTIPPIPRTMADLLAQRKRPLIRSLNDEVEQIHLALWDDVDEGDRYRDLLSPIWREQTREGSFPMDDSELGRMIRDYAKDNSHIITARSNLASIVHSLNVVRKRYRLDRRYRQGLVGGEPVDTAHSDDFAGSEE